MTNDGPHFVPPSMGDPGFFMCGTEEEWYELLVEQLHSYAPGSPKHEMAKERLRYLNMKSEEK